MSGNDEKDPDNVEMGGLGDAEDVGKAEEKQQFLPNGDDVVVVRTGTSSTDSFVGLGKEELLEFAEDPYWIRVRYILFILFWLIWLGMLVAAIVIIVLAPKCPPVQTLAWYESGTVYQVYPRSFKDSGSDGNGDLKGLESKLDYLALLKVKTLWLTSVYKSVPGSENIGYEAIDQRDVDPVLGTLEDFKSLVAKLHNEKYEMKIILDFVPNFTSKKHNWFDKSQKSMGKYKDYYIWNAGTNNDTSPPNDMKARDSLPAWTKDPVRGDYYYSAFSKNQPELNIYNADVRKELEETLRFWLDHGVDGLFVRNPDKLAELKSMLAVKASSSQPSYQVLDSGSMFDMNDSLSLISEWRKIVKSYSSDNILLTGDGMTNGQQYGSFNGSTVCDLPVNAKLYKLKSGCDGSCVYEAVNGLMNEMASTRWPSWMTGSFTVDRLVSRSRLSSEYVDASNMLIMLLPGTSFTYYGEEIGMSMSDHLGINKMRTPMQWNEDNSDFSKNKSWIEHSPKIHSINVQTELSTGAGLTHLEVYKALANLRMAPSFQWGKFYYSVSNKNIFSFVKRAHGFDSYLVTINFGSNPSTNNYVGSAGGVVPSEAKIVGYTAGVSSDFKNGTTVSLSNVLLKPGWGVVFAWPNEMK